MFRVGIVAGEASGDLLGADLIRALTALRPDAEFTGIAGPAMREAGCRALFPVEDLSVMGFAEVIGRLPALLRIRASVTAHFRKHPPDVFVGIDAPDFNVGLETRLKARGIPVVHFVSPTVWAWRGYRVRKLARAMDMLLTLFPFEGRWFDGTGIDVRHVGHPMADAISLRTDRPAARQRLGLPPGDRIIALLPGSRESEVRRLAGIFVETAQWCDRCVPGLRFVVPAANDRCRRILDGMLSGHDMDGRLTVIDGRARDAMAAADVVLTASGTAALEAMLVHTPMVVAYRMAWPSYLLVKRLARVRHFALPNILAGDDPIVPEFHQWELTPGVLGSHLLRLLLDRDASARAGSVFSALHRSLRRDAARGAARAVLELGGGAEARAS